jgi:hypothetical protein
MVALGLVGVGHSEITIASSNWSLDLRAAGLVKGRGGWFANVCFPGGGTRQPGSKPPPGFPTREAVPPGGSPTGFGAPSQPRFAPVGP